MPADTWPARVFDHYIQRIAETASTVKSFDGASVSPEEYLNILREVPYHASPQRDIEAEVRGHLLRLHQAGHSLFKSRAQRVQEMLEIVPHVHLLPYVDLAQNHGVATDVAVESFLGKNAFTPRLLEEFSRAQEYEARFKEALLKQPARADDRPASPYRDAPLGDREAALQEIGLWHGSRPIVEIKKELRGKIIFYASRYWDIALVARLAWVPRKKHWKTVTAAFPVEEHRREVRARLEKILGASLSRNGCSGMLGAR